jgi:anaerobic selenocysteine-containing dehydrogenase
MDVTLTRRQFFKICATGMAGSSLAALGFTPTAALAEVREFKLLRTNSIGETMLATPALVDGTWYFRTAAHLIAVGRPAASGARAGTGNRRIN